MPDELELLKRALWEERRITAAICLMSPNHQIRVPAEVLDDVSRDPAISTCQNADGSLTISVKPRP